MRSNVAIRFLTTAVLVSTAAAYVLVADERAARVFSHEDPRLHADDMTHDASGVAHRSLGRYADFVLNTYYSPGNAADTPAQNVNTLGNVPDSSWFTNRIGARRLSIEEIVRGPDRVERLTTTRWVIVEGKDTGRQPGFRAIDADDPSRTLYQVEFDPPSNPEMATGAEIIGTAIYHALGYNVVETHLIAFDPRQAIIAPDATTAVNGRRRSFTRRDLDGLLRRVARRPDGLFRATASRYAEGRYLGPFRYYGTRPDDPNDRYPHEHRRELRGNRVFAAWLNHDDSRAGNSLDMLVGEPGRKYVKHYMFDFGSILGSGTNEEDHPWVGHEYLTERKPGLKTLMSFGVWRRPFISVRAPAHLPAAGNFTADGFDASQWRPHYPNPAFRRMQPEDAFWAARLVAAFTPEAITAIVAKAQFSDPRVTDYVAGTLIVRRERVLRTWLTGVNPLGDARLTQDGVLHFENAAERAGVSDKPSEYELSWFEFDNESGRRTFMLPAQCSSTTVVPIPAASLIESEYVGVEVRTHNERHAHWATPVTFFFQCANGKCRTVGIERGLGLARRDHMAGC